MSEGRTRDPLDELRKVNERLVIAGVREQELSQERERLLAEARDANQAKDDFLAIMSHELRTPLTVILGYADLLTADDGAPLTQTQAKRLGRIQASGRHLLALIDELLAYSRIAADRETVHVEHFDLPVLIRDAAGKARPLFEAKGIALEVQAPDHPVEIESDRQKIRQILVALLENAARFADGGKVILRGRVEDGTVIIEVSDTGIGIPEDELERIFEPFHQVEAPLTRHTGGTGLGLTVARRLARLLGGDVTVESTLGDGSTFTVRLPAHP